MMLPLAEVEVVPDTERPPPGEQQVLPFIDEWRWTSHLEGQPLSAPNPQTVPCTCTDPCNLGSHIPRAR
jgi:hypothetical protein